MMAPVRRKEFCPSYFAELVGPTRARYEAKISMCDGVEPYTLCAADTTTDVELLPVTTHADIVNYLVLWTNHVSLTEMKAYMSLEAHNYFTSGRVSGVTAKRLPSKRVIVLSEVKLFSRRLLTEVIVCIDHFRRRMVNLCRLNVSCVRGCGHLSFLFFFCQPIFGALVPRSRVNARCCAVAVSQVLARHPIRVCVVH